MEKIELIKKVNTQKAGQIENKNTKPMAKSPITVTFAPIYRGFVRIVSLSSLQMDLLCTGQSHLKAIRYKKWISSFL